MYFYVTHSGIELPDKSDVGEKKKVVYGSRQRNKKTKIQLDSECFHVCVHTSSWRMYLVFCSVKYLADEFNDVLTHVGTEEKTVEPAEIPLTKSVATEDRAESAPVKAEEDVSSTLPTLPLTTPQPPLPTHTQDDDILDTWEDLKTDESESDDVEEQPESVCCVCGVGGCGPVYVVEED